MCELWIPHHQEQKLSITSISDALEYDCLFKVPLFHKVYFIDVTKHISLAFPTDLVQIHDQPFSHYAARQKLHFIYADLFPSYHPQLVSFPYLNSFHVLNVYFRFCVISWAQNLVDTGFRKVDCKSHFKKIHYNHFSSVLLDKCDTWF